ncbi:MAG: glutamine--fructose-6-phosphate transaminase (isomerizing) [Candidatus Margulisbacteria bacterium]|nr:glutamine--fructose-6-phosphate transaminase (isomerizing) [Candidatus Margulisiibacteriota bacterium]
MCGIFGYIGDSEASEKILTGLKKLEYRGYDSIGVATMGDKLEIYKNAGKVSDLESIITLKNLKGTTGIGHTRWATHGAPTECNAHPHFDEEKKIAIVHNGIIENYQELRDDLIKDGFKFTSETDSEVIVHLISACYQKSKNVEEAFLYAIKRLRGAYAICCITEYEPSKMFLAKKASPLLVGVGEGENYCASDVSPILKHTRNIIYLDDNEYAVLTTNSVIVKNYKKIVIEKEIIRSTVNIEDVEKGSYDFYMMKEIHEQPESIINTITNRCFIDEGKVNFDFIGINYNELLNINRIVITACGTSLHAGLVGEFYLEKFAQVPVEVEYAAEFRYRNPIIDSKTLVIAISQSGETADTLAAVLEAKQKKARIISICNVPGSTIARESDGVIYTKAGVEIGVASTKAFTTQITALYMFSIFLARIKWIINKEEAKNLLTKLYEIPELIRRILLKEEHIYKIASKYYTSQSFLYLGRGISFHVAQEGALKMKEISYIHAEGYSAAEMKHGPIALIDENMPVVVIALKTRSYEKIIGNISEVKARQGKVIAIATVGDTNIKNLVDDVIYIPDCEEELSAILSVIPLQLLAYYTAILRGCHVDQPRNLAKSVTVE